MAPEDRAKIKQAFLDAAESPAAARVFAGTHVTYREMLLHAADSDDRYREFAADIAAGHKTVDGIVDHLRMTYPQPA